MTRVLCARLVLPQPSPTCLLEAWSGHLQLAILDPGQFPLDLIFTSTMNTLHQLDWALS